MSPAIPSLIEEAEEWFYWCTPAGDERLAIGVAERFDALPDQAATGFFTLSFDGSRVEFVRPERIHGNLRDGRREPLRSVEVAEDPAYSARVADAVRAIDAGLVSKVVVARRDVRQRSLDIGATLSALCAANPDAFVYGRGFADGTAWVGATPERLVRVEGNAVSTAAIAGTAAPEGADQLLSSPKDLAEHQAVVDMLRTTLQQCCDELHVTTGPSILKLPNLVHLVTPLTGLLRAGGSPFEVVTALHPTPAVCGTPRDAAKKLVAELEPFDRELYAGVVGWCEPGELDAAVAIRCMRTRSGETAAYAGAGIVAASEPGAEEREVRLKLASIWGSARWSDG